MHIQREQGKIDWMITSVPLVIVITLCVLFFVVPEQSNEVLRQIRCFLGDTFGEYYLIIGLGIFILSLYIGGSNYGNIVLGEPGEKPKYSFFCLGIDDVHLWSCSRYFVLFFFGVGDVCN